LRAAGEEEERDDIKDVRVLLVIQDQADLVDLSVRPHLRRRQIRHQRRVQPQLPGTGGKRDVSPWVSRCMRLGPARPPRGRTLADAEMGLST